MASANKKTTIAIEGMDSKGTTTITTTLNGEIKMIKVA
jgi:thymidylate kinase